MKVLGWMLIALGAGLAGSALLGPLVLGVIEYHLVDDVINQVVGGDAVGLLLVAPVSVVAGILVLRGHPAGPIMALAPAGYAVYTQAQLAIGGEFAVEPGNSERFFPFFLALVLIGGFTFLRSWGVAGDRDLPEPSGRLRTTAVTVLLVLAGFLTLGLHAPGLADIIGGEPFDVEYTQSPVVYLVVKLMDLAIVVPAAIAAAVGMLRRSVWATPVMYTVIGWGALLGSAVAGMAIVMQVNDDPAASLINSVVFVGFAAAFLILAAWIYRPLFAAAPRPMPAPEREPVTVGGR